MAMYKTETLVAYVSRMKERISHYKGIVNTLKTCVSYGNRKIGHVLNVSLAPIVTCGSACAFCKKVCYDIKACLQYGNVLEARARNTALALYNRTEYFAGIQAKLTAKRKYKLFRWHVAGDILDLDYLDNMVRIARQHPDWIFWTYTKQYALVNQYVKTHGGSKEIAIPSNLSIMFSVWNGLQLFNPYDFATFVCVMKNDPENVKSEKRNCHKCPGNCDICKAQHTGCPYHVSSWVDEH